MTELTNVWAPLEIGPTTLKHRITQSAHTMGGSSSMQSTGSSGFCSKRGAWSVLEERLRRARSSYAEATLF